MHYYQTLEAYISKFGEDIGIQKFYENYMLVKLRHDVPTDDLNIAEACHGYALEYWDSQRIPAPSEPDEEVPEINFD